MTRSKRPPNRYELLSCAWSGHALVGVGAETPTLEDASLVREMDGIRWHRCLRCDGWFPQSLPESPSGPVPAREQILVPVRGKALRDKYVLRLIAVDRAIHVFVLGILAFGIFFLLDNHDALQHDYTRIVNDFTGGSGGPNSVHGFLGAFRHLFLIKASHLYEAGLVVLAYAALEATEMVGLWFQKRWAEYLTFIATFALVPFEVYEMYDKFSVLKFVTFVINVAIAVYLICAKRLFGVRGGRRAAENVVDATSGWAAIERAAPAFALD